MSHRYYYDLKFMFLSIVIITLLPVPFYVFKIAHYGYGFTVVGILIWLATLSTIGSMLLIHRLRVSLPVMPHARCGILESWVVIISYFSSIGLWIENMYIRRPEFIGIFDVYDMYELLGRAGGDGIGLSLFGKVCVFLSGMSFYLVPKAILCSKFRRKVLYVLPAIFVVTNMALIGARQIVLFLVLLIVCAFSVRIEIKNRILKITVVMLVSFALIFGAGFLRGGIRDVDKISERVLELTNTKDSVNLPRNVHVFLAHIFSYAGGAPEVISIITNECEPSYILFSTTNSLVYRNLRKFMELPSYEDDIRHRSHDPFYNATGYFPRVWGTGNIQLYGEGGLLYIFIWYTFLVYWFFKIYRDAKRGKDVFVSLCFFFAMVIMHQLIFPLRDPRIFLSFFWFVVLNFMMRRRFFIGRKNKPFRQIDHRQLKQKIASSCIYE